MSVMLCPLDSDSGSAVGACVHREPFASLPDLEVVGPGVIVGFNETDGEPEGAIEVVGTNETDGDPEGAGENDGAFVFDIFLEIGVGCAVAVGSCDTDGLPDGAMDCEGDADTDGEPEGAGENDGAEVLQLPLVL